MAKSSRLYQILKVARNATQEQILQAFRKLSLRYHPDRNPGDETAEAKFKEVQHAYDILGCDSRRSHYDQTGEELGTPVDQSFSKYVPFLMSALEATFVDIVNHQKQAKTENVIKVLNDRFEMAISKARDKQKSLEKVRKEMVESVQRFKNKGSEENLIGGVVKSIIETYDKQIDRIQKEIAFTLEVVEWLKDHEYDFVKQLGMSGGQTYSQAYGPMKGFILHFSE